MKTKKLSRLVSILRAFIYIVIAFRVIGFVGAFASDQDIYLELDGALWSQQLTSFSITDQVFIGIIIAAPSLILIWGLYQLIKLCRLFDSGVIFATDTVRCFKMFAASLIVVAVAETVASPILIGYLWLRAIIPDFADVDAINALSMVQVDVLAFGVLFFVLARIMEEGIELKQDSEMTI